jgi:lysophospholipase L1-like esterase
MGFLDVKVNPANLDPLVAGKITTPGTAVATALSATYASAASLAAKSDAVPFGLEAWRLALANRDYARADIACLGDSTTEGRGATAYSRNWVQKLQTGLRKRLGVTGGYGYIPARVTDTGSFAHPTTNTGTLYSSGFFGVKGKTTLMGTASATVTFNVTGTHADIVYISGTVTGVMRYSIDGGAYTNLDTLGGAVVTEKRQRLSFGAAGAHTITIGWVSGPDVYLDGVIVYDGDTNAGIGVHDCGHSGWTTANWMSNQGEWPRQITAAFQPQLWIVGLGINDSWGAPNNPQVPVATYKTNLNNIVTKIRDATDADPSILIHTSIPRKDATAGYGPYVQAMREVAAERSTAFYEHLVRWPNAEATQGWYVDGTHPGDLGYSALADGLAEFIAPR